MVIEFGIGILIARLLLGGGLMVHGSQKLFGWFGGYGPSGTGGFMESLGFRPGVLFAVAAGLGEFGGGLLTALGLFGAVGPALIVMVMIVAILTVHVTKGFLSSNGGWELPGMNIAAALAIAFAGNGLYALDSAFGWNVVRDPGQVWMAIGAAVVAGLLNLAARRKPAAAS
jgi:putative oxidoreductase